MTSLRGWGASGRFRWAPYAHRQRARRLRTGSSAGNGAAESANGFQPAGHFTRLFRVAPPAEAHRIQPGRSNCEAEGGSGRTGDLGAGTISRTLLRAAPPELVPVLAIGAFGGLRTSELLRLEWSEIALERGFIEITAGKAKSSRRRLGKDRAQPCAMARALRRPYGRARFGRWVGGATMRPRRGSAPTWGLSGPRTGYVIALPVTTWRISKARKRSPSKWGTPARA